MMETRIGIRHRLKFSRATDRYGGALELHQEVTVWGSKEAIARSDHAPVIVDVER